MFLSVRTRLLGIALSCVYLAGCSPTANQSPNVAASIEQTSAQRRQIDEKWVQTREAFGQAASLDKFMMQHAASVDDTKAWALVANTHSEWANEDLAEFASNTDAFDKAGSHMIQYGQDLGRSRDPKAIKLS